MTFSPLPGKGAYSTILPAKIICVAVLLALAAVGCGGSESGGTTTTPTTPATPTSTTPSSITFSAGASQSAPAGSFLPIPPAVLVRDASGREVSGIAVSFAVTGGGGSIVGGSQITNANGIATVGSWTLGPNPGTNTLTATASGLQAVITATATTLPAAAISKVAGDNLTAQPGSTVSPGPTVKVVDVNGNPVAGAAVTFAVTSGGGTLTGAVQTTNASGVATVGSWSLGPANGKAVTNSVVANVGSLLTTFTASLPAACMTTRIMTPSSTTNGSFGSGFNVCLVNGAPTDFYSLTLTAPNGLYRFSNQAPSAAFTPQINLYGPNGFIVGYDGTYPTAAFSAYLTAGAYTVIATTNGTSFNSLSGSYSLINVPVNSTSVDCFENYFAALSTTPINRTSSLCFNRDELRIYLTGGQHLTTYATSSAFSTNITLISPSSSTIASTRVVFSTMPPRRPVSTRFRLRVGTTSPAPIRSTSVRHETEICCGRG